MKTCPKTGRVCVLTECRPTTACWLIGNARPPLRLVPKLTQADVLPGGGSRADRPLFGFATDDDR
jgi:hypothetical protein